MDQSPRAFPADEPQPKFLTLHMLLIGVAATMPFAIVLADARRLGIVGTAIAVCAVVLLGVIQSIGYYKLGHQLHDLCGEGRLALVAGLANYLLIVLGGGLATALTIYLVHSTANWLAL